MIAEVCGNLKGMEVAYNTNHEHQALRHGFTLVELIVALTVVSVALSALIAMFNAGLGLARESRNRMIAAEIAEFQLHAIGVTPDMFLWHREAPGETGLFPVTLGYDDPTAGNITPTPDVRLAARGAQERNETLYRQFRWQAWGRLPSLDAQSYEITVAVRWRERGRRRTVALTSSIPRHLVDRAPAPNDGGPGS